MKTIAINKRASFDYEFLQEFEAGLVLKGYEVKSVKTGHISLKGSFVVIKENEFYLINASIPLYKYAGNIQNYEPTAARKILLNKKEIAYLTGKYRSQGLTLIPISVYNKRGKVKLKIALAKGKKQYDKREKIKAREAKRKAERYLKEFS